MQNTVTFDSALFVKQSKDSLLNLVKQDYEHEKKIDVKHDNGSFEFTFFHGADDSHYLHINDKEQGSEFLLRLVSEAFLADAAIDPFFDSPVMEIIDDATQANVIYNAISHSFIIESTDFTWYAKIFSRQLASKDDEFLWIFLRKDQKLTCYVGDIVPAGMVHF